MQLLNTQSPSKPLTLLDTFKDICQKVELTSNFAILHPEYKPFELPEEIVKRISNLPEEMQQNYWSLQLRGFLYGIYYSGSLRETLALDTENENIPLDLENNTFLGVDLEFYEKINDSNHGKGYYDSGWIVTKEENEHSLIVSKGEIKLYIERENHLQPAQKASKVGDSVSILMPKNIVQNGFYMAISDAGSHSQGAPGIPPEIVRVYWNLIPDGVINVMETITTELNSLSLPFTFKVLYNPGDYTRFDSGVLYFDKCNYKTFQPVLEKIYTENKSYFKPEIPLFTKQLAPGLGLAEEPNIRFTEVESFGMNRCQIIANGLLTAKAQGKNSSEEKLDCIFEQFSSLNLDWEHAYLNANSEDIYH